MKILITGLTGAGKSTLANELAPLIGATIFDGDKVRATYPRTVGFSHEDRILHARHMGTLCDAVTAGGNNAIASFVCPTAECRAAFNADFTIWMDRVGDKKFPTTQAIWQEPELFDLRATNGHEPYYWAEIAASMIKPVFRMMGKTALLVGRFQPFHEGHKALIEKAIKLHGQVCVGVRCHSPEWPFHRVKDRIEDALRTHAGRFTVMPLPNITSICYGRDVGYTIDKIDLDPALEAVSATKKRTIAGI